LRFIPILGARDVALGGAADEDIEAQLRRAAA
jgi:hypothetical protein